MSLDKRIFEYRKLVDTDTEMYVSANFDGNKFYDFHISKENDDKIYADSPNWIKNELFPVLSNYVYRNEDVANSLKVQEFLKDLSSDEKLVLYELLVTADSLGWMSENE